jgi:hypothetical protein
VAISQVSWRTDFARDHVTPVLVGASPAALPALCTACVAVGVLTATVTRRTVLAIGITFVTGAALVTGVPALAVWLAPVVDTDAAVSEGHVVSQRVADGHTITSYVTNASYWSVTARMSLVLTVVAIVLLTISVVRLQRVVQ